MMTISQTFLDKGKYLLVSTRGTRSKGGLQTAIRELAAYCQQHGIKRVLVDASLLVGNIDLMGWFDIGQSDDLRRAGIHKLAIVNPPGISEAKFVETVAANRGFTVKMFIDFNKAEQWILKEEG